MKISYIPGYGTNYSRNQNIINGLSKNVDLRVYGSSSKSVLIRFLSAYFKFIFRRKRDEDLVIIGFIGQPLVILLKPFIKTKLIFDAFFSVYDTMAFDKIKVKPGSLLGRFFFWLDKRSCELSDIVLLDTNEHINYFYKTFSINKSKFKRLFVGSDDSLFFPVNKNNNRKFAVGFYGWFIPLQGVEYIIKAADLLKNENVEFQILGKGQDYKKCVLLAEELNLTNVKFLNPVSFNELPDFISGLDIGLGIFGKTEKTQKVIPNKAYQIIAMKKPLITADTPAIRELLKHKQSAFLCESANPRAIANAIIELKNNKNLRDEIALKGYETYKIKCDTEKIGESLMEIINKL